MAERKPLFLGSEGFAEEMAQADSATFGSLTIGSGGDISLSGGGEVTGLPATPGGDTAAASKSYVDSVAQGLNLKESCRVRAQGSITVASPGANIDSIAMSAGDRVLMDQQGTGSEDGIYIWNGAAVAMTRATDFPATSSAAGVFTFIEEGTNADAGFVCTNDQGSDVVGTDNLVFSQFSGAGQITAGDGLQKDGDTLNVDVSDFAGTGLEDDGSENLRIASAAAGDGLQGGGGSALAVDVSDFAGTGLEDDGSENLRIATAAAGDGLTGGGGSALAVELDASGSGLELTGTSPDKTLGVKVDGSTIQVNASNELEVLGSNEATRVENTLTTATDATSDGDPVYSNGVDTVGKADASVDAKSRLLGVIRSGSGAAGSTPEVVTVGPCADVLSGATANTPYYLQSGGGIGTSLPGAGNRVVCVGYAINADDLFVRITDYGKKAA